MSSGLDFWGVRPECGCVTAWLSGDDAEPDEIKDFYVNMATTGREVRRLPFDRSRLKICPHRSVSSGGGTDES